MLVSRNDIKMTEWSQSVLDNLRKQTNGCEKVIHFNNAGASLMPNVVLDTMINYLSEEHIRGGYETTENYNDEFDDLYHQTAALINANPEEIAYTENATTAWLMAFHSIPFERGDKILTTQVEYASNYITYIQASKKFGIEIVRLPANINGEVDLDVLEQNIDNKVKLVSITHIPNNGGLVNPAEEIGKISAKYNVYYLLDACQSVGQYPVDVEAIGCHFLSATGRKYLRAPRGTGFLYVAKSIQHQVEPPFLDLHSAEWITSSTYKTRESALKFENWEKNMAAKLGFKKAVEYLNDLGIQNVWNRVQYLADLMRHKLSLIDRIVVTDLGTTKCGIVTFNTIGINPEIIKSALTLRKINVWLSSKNSTLLDMEARNLEKIIRASVHYYNTEAEIDIFCNAIEEIISNNVK